MTLPGDRREHQRLDVELPVRLELPEGEVGATALNVSEQGVRLVTDRPTSVKRRDEILVELRLRDGSPPVKALGWVADAGRSGPGDAISLTFFALPEVDARRIRAFVTAGITR